jgi:regulator of sigma D
LGYILSHYNISAFYAIDLSLNIINESQQRLFCQFLTDYILDHHEKISGVANFSWHHITFRSTFREKVIGSQARDRHRSKRMRARPHLKDKAAAHDPLAIAGLPP